MNISPVGSCGMQFLLGKIGIYFHYYCMIYLYIYGTLILPTSNPEIFYVQIRGSIDVWLVYSTWVPSPAARQSLLSRYDYAHTDENHRRLIAFIILLSSYLF